MQLFSIIEFYKFKNSWESLRYLPMHRFITSIFFFLISNIALTQVIEVTKVDSLLKDVNNNMKADPGDSLRYTAKIIVTGANATNVMFDTVDFDPNLTINPNYHISPLARQDNYNCIGNVGLNVLVASGLLANDVDLDNNVSGGLKIMMAGATSPNTAPGLPFTTTGGGEATLNADSLGAFTYSPPAGHTGLDSFVYKLTDSDPITPDRIGLAIVTVSDLIWFVDNTGGGTGGAGSLAEPYKRLEDLNAAQGMAGGPAAGQNIYIEHTGTNYTGGVNLLNDQKLVGEGASASLQSIFGITLPTGSTTLPTTFGPDPIITNISGDGITLASGNTIRGLNIGACSDFGIDDNGNVGTLTITEVDINNTTGGGFRTDGGGTLAVSLGSLASTGGVNGINLSGVGGTFNVSGNTTINNSTSTAANISSNNSTVTFIALNITNTTSNQKGIFVSGGTLNSTSGTINTGSATILDIDNAVLGMTLTSISSTTSAVNAGIDINGTTGSLTVNGGTITRTQAGSNVLSFTGTNTGTYNLTAVTLNGNNSNGITLGSGQNGTFSFGDLNVNTPNGGIGVNVNNNSGEITFKSIDQNGGNTGISLSNTTGSFTVTGDGTGAMNASGGLIQNVLLNGIFLSLASDVSLTQLNITNAAQQADGVAADDHAINISSVTNFTYQDAIINGFGNSVSHHDDQHCIRILNLFGSSLIEDVQFDDINEDAIEFINNSADNGTRDILTVHRGDFNNHLSTNGEMGIDFQASGTSKVGLIVDSCTFDINANGALGIVAGSIDNADYSLVIESSTFNAGAAFGSGTIQVVNAGNSVATNTITNNMILNTNFGGIILNNDDDATSSGTISSNQITGSGIAGGNNGHGIQIRQDENGEQTVLISENTITGFTANGINLLSRDRTAGVAGLNATITGNTATVDPASIGAGLSAQSLATNSLHLSASLNLLTGAGGFPGFSDGIVLNEGGTSTLKVEQLSAADLTAKNNSATVFVAGTPLFNQGAPPTPLRASMIPFDRIGVTIQSTDQLTANLKEAILLWTSSGLDDIEHSILDAVSIELTDLPDDMIGNTFATRIYIDKDAANHGWFIDQTPSDNNEFINNTPDGIDLLTMLMHEIGHILGKTHDPDDPLMQNTLDPGVRKFPCHFKMQGNEK